MLWEAAAVVEARGGTRASCEVSSIHSQPCRKKAEVSLADSGGENGVGMPGPR